MVLGPILYVAGLGDPVIVSATPNSVSGNDAAGTTASITVTPSGGVGPYTYLWESESIILDGGAIINPTAYTSATTAFNYVATTESLHSETYRCTVTDSLLNTGYYIITVYVLHIDIGGF